MTQDSMTDPATFDWTPTDRDMAAWFFLGRAESIIEGLVESPTDAIGIRMAQEFLADYRRWLDDGAGDRRWMEAGS